MPETLSKGGVRGAPFLPSKSSMIQVVGDRKTTPFSDFENHQMRLIHYASNFGGHDVLEHHGPFGLSFPLAADARCEMQGALVIQRLTDLGG